MSQSQPSAPKTAAKSGGKSKSERRPYHSPLRKRQTAETRQRIISAGVELIHELPDWDWKDLTFRAVGERAGISERTVYRHFSSERKLKDAIMQQLVDDSGVDLKKLELKDFPDITATVFRFLSSVAYSPIEEEEPTFALIDEHRRKSLLEAVARETPEWSEEEQETTAAMLDLLWNLPPYERLLNAWRFDTDRAINAVSWLISLIQDAIAQDRRPK